MKTKVWIRSSGIKVPIKKMNDGHLDNAIKLTERKMNVLLEEYFKLNDKTYRYLVEEKAKRKSRK